ncbi:MAG: hypothetical protein AAF355_01625 [Myxococcota bacterium]
MRSREPHRSILVGQPLVRFGFGTLIYLCQSSACVPIEESHSNDSVQSTSEFGLVRLSPGFQPDPWVVSGRAGGPVQGSLVHASCPGWRSRRPGHTLRVTDRIQRLRILVRALRDSTLIVQNPNGSLRCNDDAEDRNPIIDGAFEAGTYRVWVGTYSETKTLSYRLGFSELEGVSARDLR